MQFDSSEIKIGRIPGDESEVVPLRGGCDLAVQRWNVEACLVPFGFQLAPHVSSARIKAQDTPFHAITERLEPGMELRFSFSRRQAFDAAAEFPNGNGADIQFRFVVPEPRDDFRISLALHRFAEDIGID